MTTKILIFIFLESKVFQAEEMGNKILVNKRIRIFQNTGNLKKFQHRKKIMESKEI